MDLKLKDKVALVTGGSHGLGKPICLTLASEGVRVAVNYRKDRSKADAVAEEIRSNWGMEAMPVYADVSKEGDVHDMFDRVVEKFSQIDFLVNNAGICPVSFIKDMDWETWDRTIDVNLGGTFLTSREMVRHLIETERPGRIVNIASQAAFSGSATGKGHYAASKAGVVALTISLAQEVAGHGIAVNAVAPGMIWTEMTAETLKRNAEKYRKKIPLGRAAKGEEIADVVAFLCSEKAGYITGATVDISGGMLMR